MEKDLNDETKPHDSLFLGKGFGVFSPLLYLITGIISTCLGVMIRGDVGWESPITWAFFVPLVLFFFFYGYAIIFKDELFLPESARKYLKEKQYQKGRKPKIIDKENVTLKPKT